MDKSRNSMQPIITKKWGGCRFALPFGFLGRDEAGYALQEAGINENYGCEQPEVVHSGNYQTQTFDDNGRQLKVAKLYGTGKFDDPAVLEALSESCGRCPFYIMKVGMRS